jgi:outer membrane receptor protein involved in Fe transport
MVKRGGSNFNVGARFSPFRRLMLRGSFATGELYPTVDQVEPRFSVRQFTRVSVSGPADPARGGEPIGGGEAVKFLVGGSLEAKSELAQTISLGAVFNPVERYAPRVSVDYSHIMTRRAVSPFFGNPTTLISDEQAFPGRIVRAHLTDADVARGYTAGRVTAIDLTSLYEGRAVNKSVDVDFTWRFPLPNGDELDLYGSGTWQLSLRQREGDRQPWRERVGFYNGPLSWRGNVGAEWRKGSLAVNFNVQFFSRYRVTMADLRLGDLVVEDNEQTVRNQGRDRIPNQAYADVAISRRLRLSPASSPLKAVDVRFGVQNVFDKRPPTVANEFDVPYSTYGDARRRRFSLAVLTEF